MKSKGRGQPSLDATSSIRKAALKLEELLDAEVNYPQNNFERKTWEVTLFDRDGAAHIIRFLNIWFDLPQIVFFSATSYMDQFLALIKVHIKFLPCLMVSCFSVAAQKHHFIINSKQLVKLSQSKCTIQDMERMGTIVEKKLGLKSKERGQYPTTYDLLMCYIDIFTAVTRQFKIEAFFAKMSKLDSILIKLQVLMCESSCTRYNSSMLALSLLQFELEKFISKRIARKGCHSTEIFYLLVVMIELPIVCKMNKVDYVKCFATVKNILNDYNDRKKTKHTQKLLWQFSTPVTLLSKHSQNFYAMLNTVEEE